MVRGGIRNLDMSPNKLFIEEAYIDEDFDSDEYKQVDQPHNHGSLQLPIFSVSTSATTVREETNRRMYSMMNANLRIRQFSNSSPQNNYDNDE